MKLSQPTGQLALAFLLAALCQSTRAADPIPLAEITPRCVAPFKINDKKTACEIDTAALSALNDEIKANLDKAPLLCAGPGLKLTDKVCVQVVGKAPSPTCGDALPDLTFANGQCVIDRKVPRSASGDYVGDCFRLDAIFADGRLGFPAATRLKVLSQRTVGVTDRELTVALSEGTGMSSCKAVSGAFATPIKASDLIDVGARRIGWAYGVLALPFKYYSHSRNFGSNVSVGPYFGRRWGTPGSAYTLALAATIGSVKGEVRNAAGAITETPDLQAFSVAAGYMFDVAKSEGAKPFKIGLFVGADWVGASNVVKYANNRKPWIAFQIGYDFTDN
jgi:hypothetical protein